MLYVKDNYFCTACSKTTQVIRGTWFIAVKH